MSAAPGEFALGGTATETSPPVASLSPRAKAYFAVLAAATAVAAIPPIARLDIHTHGWPTFLALAACAGIAQLFGVTTIRDHSYQTSIVFLIAAALLLPPELVALMGVVQHIPEWLRTRLAWYIQTFNICNYTLDALAAWWAARLLRNEHVLPLHSGQALAALAGLAACLVFVGLNYLLLSLMLYLGRGHRPRDTGLFAIANVSTDLVLAALGIGIASLWQRN